jgi:DNA modification methylase
MLPINQILQGDCKQVLRSLPNESVDLVVTDPPYLARYKDRFGRTLANDDNPAAVVGSYAELYRILKPNTFCVTFYGYPRLDAFVHAWTRAGFDTVGHIVWPKPYASSERFVRVAHESAYVLVKGRPEKPVRPLNDVQPWEYSGNRVHPTEKAVSVLKPLIQAFSRPGDLVCDPFAGSGSTLVAAALTGRRYLGIELEAKYCELIRDRLERVSSRRHHPTSHEPRSAHVSTYTVAMRDLCKWLRDRDYPDLAQTVRDAIESCRS